MQVVICGLSTVAGGRAADTIVMEEDLVLQSGRARRAPARTLGVESISGQPHAGGASAHLKAAECLLLLESGCGSGAGRSVGAGGGDLHGNFWVATVPLLGLNARSQSGGLEFRLWKWGRKSGVRRGLFLSVRSRV